MVPVAVAGLALISTVSNFVLIPVSVNLIITTFFIVYIGCHMSLKLMLKPAEGETSTNEAMSRKDAYMFPFIGSGVLFSLYAAFKFFGKEAVNKLLAVYFGLVGTLAMTGVIDEFLMARLFPKDQKVYKWSYKIPLLMKEPEVVTFSTSTFPSAILAGAVTGGYFYTRHSVLNNLFGAAFSLQGIAQMSLGNYTTGAVLLCGLFVYDIFWVFGTDVMVTVAKSFDAPIKLLFLKSFAEGDEKAQYSMLGLGDIVIPGIFIALLLRFDAHRYLEAKKQEATPEFAAAASFPKPYFHTAILMYVAGLATTVAVMFFFEAAQPALLYLVPACLIASCGTAFARGEFKEMLAYDEEHAAEDDKEKAGEKKTK